MRVKACGLSDVGLTRAHNEDYFEIDPQHRLYVVADGMGGHSHGEVASQLAVNSIREFIAKSADHDNTWPFGMEADLARHSNLLKMAVRIAHDQVLKAITKDGSLYGMGTTVVGMLMSGTTAAVAHVGDSRAYRLRDGRLEQLTQDHTWVNEQVVAGFLSREQARSHPLKNVVTRALGGESDVLVDVRELEARAGRPLPPLLRRPHRHALRRRPPRPPRLRPQPPRDLPHPDQRLQRPRRHRQHHRRPAGDRGGRRQRPEPRGGLRGDGVRPYFTRSPFSL